MDEEVQLGSATKEDDYEVVPVGLMRKLERRMDEPKQTNTQAVQSVSEAAEMILRIDDVISASGFDADGDGAGGPPGGGMGSAWCRTRSVLPIFSLIPISSPISHPHMTAWIP